MKVAVNTAKLLRNVPLPDEIQTVHDNAVVIDMGTSLTRIGFGGEDSPRLLYPSIVGAHPTDRNAPLECFNKAQQHRESLHCSRVLSKGLVQDWNAWTAMMQSLFDQLNLYKDPNAPLLISEVALAPREQREKMVEILFEQVQAQAVYFSTAPVMAMYASGRTSGMVIEMGAESCHTVPVFEGLGLFHSFLELDYGGDDLTTVFSQSVMRQPGNQHLRFSPHHEKFIFQYAKELHVCVQPDAGSFALSVSEGNQHDVVHHKLPDGAVMKLGPDRYRIAESFFDPAHVGRDGSKGIQHLAVESVNKCDVDIAPLLLGNVVLSGGASLTKGMPERVSRELQDLTAGSSGGGGGAAAAGGTGGAMRVSSDKVRVYAATERRHATWVGGSILSSLPTFQDFWITKADYDEAGPEVRRALGHRNCI